MVDNGATLAGGSCRKRFPDVQLVENAGNVDFARAANPGDAPLRRLTQARSVQAP